MTQSLIFPHLRINVAGMDEDHIAELITAKADMWDGQDDHSGIKEEYLCHQLNKHPSKSSELLYDRVQDALAPCISFQGAMSAFDTESNTQQTQVQKMLWIDQMIADIKEQLK